MKRSIITVAPNGARKTKEDLQQIPLWADEIAVEAANCAEAGAAIIHLHVRDENQGHTIDPDIYRRTIDAIRDKAGDKIIVQATSEACGIYTPEQQMQMVRDLRPEAVSIAVREFIPSPDYEGRVGEFLHWVQENNIWPQFILYSPDELRYFADLCARGLVPAAHHFVLLVLGKKQRVATADAFAKPEDLNPFLDTLKELGFKHDWAICAFGGNENACVSYALENGGHARIGFENNHLRIDQSTAGSNAELITQFVKTADIRPYTANEVREKFSVYNKAA